MERYASLIINMVKMSSYIKQYSDLMLSLLIPNAILYRNAKTILKWVLHTKVLHGQYNPENNQVEGSTLPDSELYYKVIAIKKYRTGLKNRYRPLEQKRAPGKSRPISWFPTMARRGHSGERTTLSVNGPGKTGPPHLQKWNWSESCNIQRHAFKNQ